jgi:acyl carrier protein
LSDQELLLKVREIFRDVFDDPDLKIERESSAATVEGWDSLIHINLVSAIERSFHVRFALGELQSLKNVGDLLDCLQAKLAKASA